MGGRARGGGEWRWRAVLTRPILQNIQEGISVIFSVRLRCPVLWAEASVPFSSGQFIPSTGHVVMSLFIYLFFLKIHQMGICSFLHGDVCGVCSGACIMLVLSVCGHPSIHHRSLLEVGVVRKGIDVLLDHFVAELVLLLRKGRGETATSDWTTNTIAFWSHSFLVKLFKQCNYTTVVSIMMHYKSTLT